MGIQPEETEDVTITDVSKLAEQISALYLSPKFSDITLILNGQKLHAHRVILAARSEYFEALLYNGSEESNQSELTFNDISPNAFRMLLKYIYTGSVTMVPSNIDLTLEMMGLAHQYSFPDVESAIIKKLKTMLNLTNICSILNMANVYNLNELREVCHVFMDKHALEILKCDCFNELTQMSMIKLLQRDTFFAPEGEIFKSVAKWCKVNNDVDDLVVKSVRLSWLTVVEIVSIVWPSKLLHNEILLNAIAEIVDVKPRRSHCRAKLLMDENIATPQHQAEAISGKDTAFLLTGNRDVGKYARHTIGDQNGITVKLATPAFINHIYMMLWDKEMRYYCYYVEVSLDQRKWKKVIDYSHSSCRSYQNLFLEEEIVQYIRVVGTHNTANNEFHLIFLEAHYKTSIPRIVNGVICPITNVATLDKKAIVIEGVNPNYLLDGDTKNYDGSIGYTYHIIGKGSIVVQLAQPYMISSMKMLLWDKDARFYKYYIEVSVNKIDWKIVTDLRSENCRSWQVIRFAEQPMVYIRITGTHNSNNDSFHCVHFECPASDEE